VLYSMAGKPSVNATEPFADVGASDWYYKPVVWAYKNGIVAGTSANSFSPNSNITREQMVAIFSKYAAYKGLKTPASANITGYSDRHSISSYATNAFKWAVGAGIISGTSATTLSPQGNATRAQCAVIIRQFVKWAEKGGTTSPTPTPDFDNGGREDELPIG
ncbi:MAG: S-layer homology domain-containing protein, partial [Oscillospiraceae bacterium]|nr:S-layer homology domain-containing protein [Oscillospiraceae bacterium]